MREDTTAEPISWLIIVTPHATEYTFPFGVPDVLLAVLVTPYGSA